MEGGGASRMAGTHWRRTSLLRVRTHDVVDFGLDPFANIVSCFKYRFSVAVLLNDATVFNVVSFMVLMSVFVHGLSASPMAQLLAKFQGAQARTEANIPQDNGEEPESVELPGVATSIRATAPAKGTAGGSQPQRNIAEEIIAATVGGGAAFSV